MVVEVNLSLAREVKDQYSKRPDVSEEAGMEEWSTRRWVNVGLEFGGGGWGC